MAPIPLVAERSKEIADLCRKHQVPRLDLFGSAATGHFDPDSSDLNFPSPSAPNPTPPTSAPTTASRPPLDLVIDTDFKNLCSRKAVEQRRRPIYVAYSKGIPVCHPRHRAGRRSLTHTVKLQRRSAHPGH